MDSSKFHQAGCMRSLHPGVGVGPGGFIPPGGGSRPRRDRPSDGLKKLFARLSTLSLSRQTVKVRGQALVELAVILPVLVLFMAAVLPLIVKGVALPWLDERLTLRQLSQNDEQVHRQLQLTHESDLLPPYFDNTRLEESTQNASMGMSLPLLGKNFPREYDQETHHRHFTRARMVEPGDLWQPAGFRPQYFKRPYHDSGPGSV